MRPRHGQIGDGVWGKSVLKTAPRFYGALFVFGALAALAMAPLYFFMGILVGLSALFLLLRANRDRSAFWAGWWWAFGYFTFGLYWISFAMLVEPYTFAWMVPLAALALPAILSFYVAIALWCGARLSANYKAPLARSFFAFTLLLFLSEVARGHLLTGFPWNLFAYSFGFSDALMQGAALFGAYGLSFVAILFASSFALLLEKEARIFGAITLLTVCIFIYGALRLEDAGALQTQDLRIRIVQANIKQNLKWESAELRHNFEAHIQGSALPYEEKPDLIVWPETAVPYPLDDAVAARDSIAAVLPKGSFLLTGAPRISRDDAGEVTGLYNSLVAINDKGDIVAHYDKSHLVPFGEYVPLSNILPLKKIAAGMMDYSSGAGAETLAINSTIPAFSPLICYEVIFPGNIVNEENRPSWILNITNDGWYGKTAGPYQHLAAARMRAIEEGLPLIRAANTGISAVIDPYGRIVKQLPLGGLGILDSPLPMDIKKPPLYVSLLRLF